MDLTEGCRTMKKRYFSIIIAMMLAAALALPGGGGAGQDRLEGSTLAVPPVKAALGGYDSSGETDGELPETMERPSLLGDRLSVNDTALIPSVQAYSTDASLSNVMNADRFYISDGERSLLAQNLFAVTTGYNKEFFEAYEMNRYNQIPNFITVDSLMHTYHLFFSHLMKRTEKTYIANALYDLGYRMMIASIDQYNTITDENWKLAAFRNVAFFVIGCRLQEDSSFMPEQVAELVNGELEKIYSASGIAQCGINERDMDYTQFIPRGYYEGDEQLEKYFRAMMWYGQVGFFANNDTAARSAALMTLALSDDIFESWESIYTVTSFFAGASDDLTYYDYKPAIGAVYGEDIETADLQDEDLWVELAALVEEMPVPVINSVPMTVLMPDQNAQAENKGFRFMGQRFTIDAAIMTDLIYNKVGANSSGETRLLPDALDVAAALGSDAALSILEEGGAADYAGYPENMQALREGFEKADDSLWMGSLYANWLYTLNPLLVKKGEGYPSFMQSDAWAKKDLESFEGSYTELKHDTVLYAKQVMAEMGGGDGTVYDDRGYVEPEPEVWGRFVNLSEKTMEGLDSLGYLTDEDRNDLSLLTELAKSLLVISEKELRNELPSDAEFELIRNYGGNLEHLWIDAVKEDAGTDTPRSSEFPAALVTDIASNSSGEALEIATGNPSTIHVIVPVDGTLRICAGQVYTFYEFKWPSDNRLTDTAWRQMMGFEVNESGSYNNDKPVSQPGWTQSYRIER